jgi:regulator of protease activity HflC (stomatin/prohibitin superfamily)
MNVLFDYLPWIVVGVAAFLLVVPPGVRIITQYERGVQLRFGRYVATKEPGIRFMIPWVDRMIKVDMRTLTWILDERQEVITRDNVTVHVDAVVYFNVIDPVKAVLEVADYRTATEQLALTSLRSVLGQSDLDEVLSERDRINGRLRDIIDEHTEDPWGVRISLVEVKDVLLPDGMQRIMARAAQAEREKRAKIIHAEGEYLAAETLTKAASVMGSEPMTLQLRYLETLVELAGQSSSTIIPLPLDVLKFAMAQVASSEGSGPRPVEAEEIGNRAVGGS